jgi:hypothetical protein
MPLGNNPEGKIPAIIIKYYSFKFITGVYNLGLLSSGIYAAYNTIIQGLLLGCYPVGTSRQWY